MLSAERLRKDFGAKTVVQDVEFSLRKGELFGFLGPNGAGKTTTIRMLVGLLTPTSGRAVVGSFDIHKQPLQAKRLIGYVSDRPLVYDKLTGREYVRFMAELYEAPKETIAEMELFFTQFELLEVADELISSYSHGMKQKIALIGQLVHRPQVLLLDEPTVGLDPKGAKTLRNVLRGLCEQGVTVLISTHLLPIAELLCDRVGIMERGKIIALGTLQELQRDYQTDAGLEELFLQLTDGEREDALTWR